MASSPARDLTLDELRAKLRELAEGVDPTEDHIDADDLLLDYIGDDEVRAAFKAIRKFYD